MQRILIIAPQWIGDAVMSLPLLNLIQQNFANSKIDVLCTPWVAPIYRANPDTANVIESDFQHGTLQLGLRQATAQKIRSMNYQIAFVLPNLRQATAQKIRSMNYQIAFVYLIALNLR